MITETIQTMFKPLESDAICQFNMVAIAWSVIANYLTYPGLATGQGLDKIVLTNQCIVNIKVTLEVL